MWGQGREPQRILFVRNDRVGDLILALPALELIRRTWPQAHVTVLAGRVAAPLLTDYPTVDQLLVDDPADTAAQLATRLRERPFDTAIVAHTTWRNMAAIARAGIGCRVAWGRKIPGFLLANRRLMLSRKNPPLHEAEFNLHLVRLLGAHGRLEDLSPRLTIKDDTRRRVQQRIHTELGTGRPLFGINPSNFRGAYNWPIRSYAALAGRLAEVGRVLVTVGPTEGALAAEFLSLLPAAARGRVAVVADFSLPELAAAMLELDVLTVANTGPMHLAGALNVPLVGLFSAHPAQSPAKWRPLGIRQRLLMAGLRDGESPQVPADEAAAHMARITVDEVLQANLDWLSQKQAAA